ncbi:MAG TPA: alpha/beta fold hydrolase [Rhizomicrobium sp.]|nr:alpha/beta fold hydrolase [Rhizomicrobium sp.]
MPLCFRIAAAAGLLLAAASAAHAQTEAQFPHKEGDYVVKNFKFDDGETMAALRLHYTTLGTPVRDKSGKVTNAVLILHGTGGSGHQFFRPQFANVLFVPGGLLDIRKYFIILPDDIGHGKSSKPSDGLRAKFPHYDYRDMVVGEHAIVAKALNVNHLRLVMGTSMGCMHSFMWGEMYPDEMDALMPLACEPAQIAGRNRMWRKMTIDAIENDPAWDGGNYKKEPEQAMRFVSDILIIAGSAPQQMQKGYPTADAADKDLADAEAHYMTEMDANDWLYQVASSRDYDPSAKLETIKADVMWVNSEDDFINPPYLGIAEGFARRIPHGKLVVIPASLQTHGHGTHTWAAAWQSEMAELLKESAR